jgi:hypothetical protein
VAIEVVLSDPEIVSGVGILRIEPQGLTEDLVDRSIAFLWPLLDTKATRRTRCLNNEIT